MRDVRFWLAGFILGISLGCQSASDTSDASEEPLTLTMKTIAKGAFSAIQEPQRKVIRDKTEWQTWWKTHYSNRISDPKAGTPPEVDFENQIVLAVTMGQKRSGGYSIEIRNARQLEDRVQVAVSETSPPEGAMTIMALTAPFHVVSIPRPESPVEVEFTNVPNPSDEQEKAPEADSDPASASPESRDHP